eukprot:2620047-Alexandrium_andersonii.AAC.1
MMRPSWYVEDFLAACATNAEQVQVNKSPALPATRAQRMRRCARSKRATRGAARALLPDRPRDRKL